MTVSSWLRKTTALALSMGVLVGPAAAVAQTVTPLAPAPVTTSARPLAPLAGELTPTRGMIRAHMDQVSPFWGDPTKATIDVKPQDNSLKPFWGKIEPYRGMIRAFDGEVTPLAGMIRAHEGDLMGMRGMIRAFVGDLGATAGMIRAHDKSLLGLPNYAAALVDYRTFVSQSEAFWATPVQKATGRSFRQAFADPLLKKYGIDLNNPASLATLSADRRELFFLEWHDGLMQFSGADQVDHWMRAINWSPAITQQQGSGTRAVLGLVDFFRADNPEIAAKVAFSGGYTNVGGHGAAVASLILADHDGKGVMGIAPNARVAAFNPFDSTHTASWTDVQRGIVAVGRAGANVINLSLGVPGHTLHHEWRNVFKASEVDNLKAETLYVIAAGNSGTTQTANINFKDAFDSTFLVVGSVAPDNTISSFSNRPGTACLTDGNECKNTQRAGVGKTGDTFLKSDYLKESGLLMNRFLVAPGELILVSDGEGGVTRVSGTSFAAPLVAGAIALIHDRWPWLKKYPRDVAKILLDSATDLGEPGADAVYGRGLLNVERAQSVLDFNKLKFELWDGSRKTDVKVETLRQNGLQPIWATRDMYFSAFEKIDSAERDFLIPLSSRLFNTMKNGQYFQEFVYNHFVNWLQSGTTLAGSGNGVRGFSDVRDAPLLTNAAGWSFGMTGRLVTEHFANGGMSRPQLHSSVTVAAPGQGLAFSFGNGDGAMSLGGSGLQTTADFDALSGGVNPLLGFATGGAHASSRVTLASGLDVTMGVTTRRVSLARTLDSVADFADRTLIAGQQRYGATAYNVRVDYRAASWLALAGTVTRLAEDGAFLGAQSLTASDFGDGTATDGVTLQADVDAGSGIALFGSVTGARTASRDRDATLRLGRGGALGTAFQLGVAKQGLLAAGDRLRATLSQPLAIERGEIEFTSVAVIDRETGEKGLVTQRFDIGAPQRRRAVAELLYGVPLLDGQAQLSMFGRGELRDADANVPRLMLGGQASLSF